jgi:hypothetical protein
VLGTQAWHIQLMRGKHLLVQRVGRMKLRLRKSLQWPFLWDYTALSCGTPAIARLGGGDDFSAAAVLGTHPSESWRFCALNVAHNLN